MKLEMDFVVCSFSSIFRERLFGLFVCLYFKTVNIFDSILKTRLFPCVYTVHKHEFFRYGNCINFHFYFSEFGGLNRVDSIARERESSNLADSMKKNAVHKTQFMKFEHLVVCECDFSSCIIIRQCLRFFFSLSVVVCSQSADCIMNPGSNIFSHFHLLMHTERALAEYTM